MSYKTFTVRNLNDGWSNESGHQITIYGKFFDVSSKRLKTKSFLIVGEGPGNSMSAWDDYLYVQADRETQKQIIDRFNNKQSYDRVEVCLKGKGTSDLQVAFSSTETV
jgi:hypothetical protein